MKKQFKLDGVNVELSKEKLQDMLKEFDKKTIEFKVNEEGIWDYCLDLYIDGNREESMFFNKNVEPSYKLYKINRLIEMAIREYGGEDNFATQEDINNDDIELYGINLDNIIKDFDIIYSTDIAYKYMGNCYSKSREPIEDISEALEPVADYIRKAYRGE